MFRICWANFCFASVIKDWLLPGLLQIIKVKQSTLLLTQLAQLPVSNKKAILSQGTTWLNPKCGANICYVWILIFRYYALHGTCKVGFNCSNSACMCCLVGGVKKIACCCYWLSWAYSCPSELYTLSQNTRVEIFFIAEWWLHRCPEDGKMTAPKIGYSSKLEWFWQ